MWAAGLYDLGLTAATFWEMTPAHFAALYRRHKSAVEHNDRWFALLASMYANVHRDEKRRSHPFSIEDFMPGAGSREPTEEELLAMPPQERIAALIRARNVQTAEDQKALLRQTQLETKGAVIIGEKLNGSNG